MVQGEEACAQHAALGRKPTGESLKGMFAVFTAAFTSGFGGIL